MATTISAASPARKKRSTLTWMAWLGLVPFFIFGLAFEFLPLLTVIRSSLISKGVLTLEFYRQALDPIFRRSFWQQHQAFGHDCLPGRGLRHSGGLCHHHDQEQFVQNASTALSDVTTNFGGAPLAFAFIVILGSTGIITLLLKEVGIHLYPNFRIYSISGLTIAYLYFQIPLMILLIIPSLLGLKREWREAALNLGRIHFSILDPGGPAHPFPRPGERLPAPVCQFVWAYATAWTLTGSDVDLITIRIAALIRGEVQLAPELADALSIISLLIMISLCHRVYVAIQPGQEGQA